MSVQFSAIHPLLRSQKNDVLSRIIAAGLPGTEFEWSIAPSRIDRARGVPMLSHATHAFFIFDHREDGHSDSKHACFYSPGNETYDYSAYPGAWNGQLGELDKWLKYLLREVQAPDLWQLLLEQNRGSIEPTLKQSDDRFTPQEQELIADSIALIFAHIQQVASPPTDQLQHIEKQLEYLVTQSRKQDRRAWLAMAWGIFCFILPALEIDATAGRSIIQFISMVTAWIRSGIASISFNQ
jgi:hypothetical protein